MNCLFEDLLVAIPYFLQTDSLKPLLLADAIASIHHFSANSWMTFGALEPRRKAAIDCHFTTSSIWISILKASFCSQKVKVHVGLIRNNHILPGVKYLRQSPCLAKYLKVVRVGLSENIKSSKISLILLRVVHAICHSTRSNLFTKQRLTKTSRILNRGINCVPFKVSLSLPDSQLPSAHVYPSP